MTTGTLYVLADPRDGMVRYVGQTTKPLSVRLAGHLSSPATRMAPWIAELKAQGEVPRILAIRENVPRNDLLAVERQEITRRLVAGELLLNEAATADGRRVVQRKRAKLAAIERRDAWREAAHLTQEVLAGPLSPGQVPPVPLPRAVWSALPAIWAIEDEIEPEGRDLTGGLSKSARLTVLRAEVANQLWNQCRGAWGRLRGSSSELEGPMKMFVSGVVDHRWVRPEDASRYMSLIPWFLLAVAPWAALAARAELSLEPGPFIAWVTRDPEVASALECVSSCDPGVFHALTTVEDEHDDMRFSSHLVTVAVAQAGLRLPDLLVDDAISVLREVARQQMLTPAMAELLAQLDPRAMDRVFGPDLAANADRDLGLPPGTSVRVLEHLVGSGRVSNTGTLGRVIVRAAESLPTTLYPDYVSWNGRGIRAVRVMVVSLVCAGLLDAPAGVSRDELLAETRQLWSMDSRWLGDYRLGGLYEAA